MVWATPHANDAIVKIIRAIMKADRLPKISPQRARTIKKPRKRVFSKRCSSKKE